jgi:hypothetical protein
VGALIELSPAVEKSAAPPSQRHTHPVEWVGNEDSSLSKIKIITNTTGNVRTGAEARLGAGKKEGNHAERGPRGPLRGRVSPP